MVVCPSDLQLLCKNLGFNGELEIHNSGQIDPLRVIQRAVPGMLPQLVQPPPPPPVQNKDSTTTGTIATTGVFTNLPAQTVRGGRGRGREDRRRGRGRGRSRRGDSAAGAQSTRGGSKGGVHREKPPPTAGSIADSQAVSPHPH